MAAFILWAFDYCVCVCAAVNFGRKISLHGVTEQPGKIPRYRPDLVVIDYCLFPTAKQYHGDHRFKDGHEVETVR